uniref:Uncharacterized protein n=1 Tax=Oryza nivara TaxID=4536 RepID=A0A0E0I4T4_ORYNI
MLLDEQLHLHHELAGVGELRERVEAMDGVRVLHHPHRLPLLAQRRHVPRLPSLEQVEPADHHHRRRERLRQLDALAAAHARRRVVPGGALRQELPPEVVRPRQRQREARLVEPHLLLRPLLAAEEGRYQHGAGEPERRGRGRRRRSPALRHVVRDVPARADPAGDAAAERVTTTGSFAAAVFVGGQNTRAQRPREASMVTSTERTPAASGRGLAAAWRSPSQASSQKRKKQDRVSRVRPGGADSRRQERAQVVETKGRGVGGHGGGRPRRRRAVAEGRGRGAPGGSRGRRGPGDAYCGPWRDQNPPGGDERKRERRRL